MAGKLLDTNAVIALQKGDKELLRQIREEIAFYISSTVIGELYFGAYNSLHIQANIAVVDALARDGILHIDRETAKLYGEIRSQLKVKGRPIPENDIWFAACAIQHGLILMTDDQHFEQVDNLRVESWK